MKFLFLLLLIFMFFSSSASMLEQYSGIGVYASLLIIIILPIFFKEIKINYNRGLVLIMYAFSMFSMIAALVNSDLNLLVSSIGYFVLFLSATIIIPSYFKEKTEKMIIISILVSHVPIILLPILMDGIDSQPYRGLFDNSNSLGGIAVTLFTIFVSIFMNDLESFLLKKERSKKRLFLNLAIILLLFLLVLVTSSRTSFLAAIAVIAIGLFFLMIFSIKYKLLGNLVVKTIFSLPIFGFVFWIVNKSFPISTYANEFIINKFKEKSGDTLDGRGWVWEQTIQDAGLFGQGSDYFSSNIGLGAHNTFISILGQYGWLSLITFSLFLFVGFYYCSRYVLSNNKYKYLPLLMLVVFTVLSMGEVMLYKLSMITLFVLIGTVANNRKLILKS